MQYNLHIVILYFYHHGDTMDTILKALQNKTFHLSANMYKFLDGRYETLVNLLIPKIMTEDFHPEFIRQILQLHRSQFQTEEYINSRLNNPTTGTIDHLHAEITADTAVSIGIQKGYTGYSLSLLRTAAHFHDSDRTYPQTMTGGEQEVRHNPAGYRAYKVKHAANSAMMARNLIIKANESGYNSPEGFAIDLSYLIKRHELGGEKENGCYIDTPSAVEPELNLNELVEVVTDSDSLAYMDANILTNWEESKRNVQALTNKVHFMYDRMSIGAQEALHRDILNSENHILGLHAPDDVDIQNIREIMLKVCG
jgi:hypothetical protein